MAKFNDYINAKTLAAYITAAGSNKIPYLGATLFPASKKLGLDLKWIKTHAGLPVSLAIGAFDAKSVIRSRSGFTLTKTEMPFFREAMVIREEDRQELLRFAEMGDRYIKTILENIYNDAENLVAGAEVVAERMRMQLLSTGKIAIEDADQRTINYDYLLKSAHKPAKLTGTNAWSNADAPVTEQITGWLDMIEDDTGERPSRAILNSTTFNLLKKNKQVLADLKPLLVTQNAPIKNTQLNQWFQDTFGLSVAVYSKKFLPVFGGAAEKFFPDNVFTLLPAGNLGNTWFGTTPEEADLMAGHNANVQLVNTGVAITTFNTVDPVNISTKVSQIVLPSFEAADKIFIATVG